MHIKSLSSRNWLYFCAPFISALCTILIYLPTVHFGFLFDDVPNIMKFYDIRYATFRDLFFSRTRWLTAWIHTLHYSMGKFNPFPYRLFNILMHSMAGILIFFIFFIALNQCKSASFFHKNKFAIATLTSIFFLLHPVQTQTISYVIQGQLEGLACFFILCMVLTFLILSTINNQKSYVLLSSLLCSLALFSVGTKEIAIISPILLLLIDWFFVAQGNIQHLKTRTLLHLTLMSIIWGGYLFLLKPTFFYNLFGLKMTAHNNLGNQLTENRFDTITPMHFLISQFKVIVHYIWIFLWPFNISVDYDEKLVRDLLAPDCLGPFLIILIILGSALVLLKKEKNNFISFGILWFFISILPRSSIIPASELIADYKTYIPSVGLLFLLASICVKIVQSLTPNKRMHMSFGSLLFCCLAWSTYERNKVWSSGETLWANAIQNAPRRARVYNNYGGVLLRKQQFEEAISYFNKALELDPYYPDAYCNLALAYNHLDQPKKAYLHIYRALQLQKTPENYLNLATVLIKLERYEDALDTCLGAIEKYRHTKKSEYGKAWFNLAKCHEKLGQDNEAWNAFKVACTQADMDNEMGFKAFGHKSLELNKWEDALFAFKKAYEENPSPTNMYFIGITCIKSKKLNEAKHIFEHLYDEAPKDTHVLKALKSVYLGLNEQEKAKEILAHLTALKNNH